MGPIADDTGLRSGRTAVREPVRTDDRPRPALPQTLLVADEGALADRLRGWCASSYHVTPVTFAEAATAIAAAGPSISVVLVLVPGANAAASVDTMTVIAAARKAAPAAAIVLTGLDLRPPKWAERLAKRDYAHALVFPMAPAALHVATRVALRRLEAGRSSPALSARASSRPAVAR
ncbi:MAG: hypothetical protein NZ518_01065 [Dehalococcoidia bacterium]|nr:hypothetical protein [Dehalococcoidia bacterium]